MNKLTFIAAAALIVAACGKSDEKSEKVNTTPKVEVRDMKGLKIAYYNSDSLKLYFEYFKREEGVVTKKTRTFSKRGSAAYSRIPKFYSSKQRKASKWIAFRK